MDRRVAIVTGAAGGVGRATADRLSADGYTIAELDIKDTPYQCDVSDEAQVEATVARVADELGPPAVLCNVAGVGRFEHTHEATLAEWDRMIAVNLTGTFLMCRAVLPSMLEAGGGAIVNVASSAGLMGQAYSAAYCASKGGVVMLTKAIAFEYLEERIRVNAVAPGGVDTPLIGAFTPPEDATRRAMRKIMTPLGFCSPDEVASLIAYLVSDDARYITGAIVPIDGGLTI